MFLGIRFKLKYVLHVVNTELAGGEYKQPTTPPFGRPSLKKGGDEYKNKRAVMRTLPISFYISYLEYAYLCN